MAKRENVCEETVRRWIRDGRLGAIDINHGRGCPQYRIHKEHRIAYMNNLPADSVTVEDLYE